MAETVKECRKMGGMGKFSHEICSYCKHLHTCELSKKDRMEWMEKEKEKIQMRKDYTRKHLGGRPVSKKDLVCMYCNRNALKCKCNSKPEARFELKTIRGWKSKVK